MRKHEWARHSPVTLVRLLLSGRSVPMAVIQWVEVLPKLYPPDTAIPNSSAADRRACTRKGADLSMTSTARKILVMGLPGAGKTTLAKALAPRLNAVHFNADDVRANINKDLGFGHPGRIEQARRMGWLCDRVVDSGTYAIADFICPT